MKRKSITIFLMLLFVTGGSLQSQNTKVIEQKNTVFGMVSGLALLMDVYQPAVNSNHKAIVFIFGSAYGFYYQRGYKETPLKDDYFLDTAYGGKIAKQLVAKGYTVFCINHRFIPKFPFPDGYNDCQRAVRYIRYHARDYDIDPLHIGAIGHSSGAYYSSMLGVRDTVCVNPYKDPVDSVSSKVQAVVTLAAPFNVADIDLKKDTAMRLSVILQVDLSFMGGLPDRSRDGNYILSGKYAAASPITYVNKDNAPFLIYHSDDDPIITFRNGPAMYQKLQEAGVPSKLVMRHGDGHNPKADMDEIDKWFEKYLN
jgi:acetyl esterase/lipase